MCVRAVDTGEYVKRIITRRGKNSRFFFGLIILTRI